MVNPFKYIVTQTTVGQIVTPVDACSLLPGRTGLMYVDSENHPKAIQRDFVYNDGITHHIITGISFDPYPQIYGKRRDLKFLIIENINDINFNLQVGEVITVQLAVAQSFGRIKLTNAFLGEPILQKYANPVPPPANKETKKSYFDWQPHVPNQPSVSAEPDEYLLSFEEYNLYYYKPNFALSEAEGCS